MLRSMPSVDQRMWNLRLATSARRCRFSINFQTAKISQSPVPSSRSIQRSLSSLCSLQSACIGAARQHCTSEMPARTTSHALPPSTVPLPATAHLPPSSSSAATANHASPSASTAASASSAAQQDALSVILVTGGYDNTIRFWEAWSGVCSRTLNHQEHVRCSLSLIDVSLIPVYRCWCRRVALDAPRRRIRNEATAGESRTEADGYGTGEQMPATRRGRIHRTD